MTRVIRIWSHFANFARPCQQPDRHGSGAWAFRLERRLGCVDRIHPAFGNCADSFAIGISHWAGVAQSGAIHGLKVVAVAVVAQAVWGMARSLCPDRPRAAVAIVSTLLVLAMPSAVGQITAIAFGGVVGRWALAFKPPPAAQHREYSVSKKTGLFCWASLLSCLPCCHYWGCGTPSCTEGFQRFLSGRSLGFRRWSRGAAPVADKRSPRRDVERSISGWLWRSSGGARLCSLSQPTWAQPCPALWEAGSAG